MSPFEAQLFAPPEFAEFVSSKEYFFEGEDYTFGEWELYLPVEDAIVYEFHDGVHMSLFKETIKFFMRSFGGNVHFFGEKNIIDAQHYVISKHFDDIHAAYSFALDRYKTVQNHGIIRKPGTKLYQISGSNYEPLALDNYQIKPSKGEKQWPTPHRPNLPNF